ncbi:MAG: hypothetical protein ABIW76_14375 [Fibrobacteria bacterium]
MAAIGIEIGSVTDRSFSSATGFMKKFKDWVVKTYANHGPLWYIYDDQSAIGTDPYIVISNQASPTANSKAVFIQCKMISASERVDFISYLAWDLSSHTGMICFGAFSCVTTTGTFAYYFRGGPGLISVVSRIGTTVYSMRVTTWTGIWDSTYGKGTEPESASGALASPAFLETDSGGYLSGYHNITGYTANLDASGKLYFNIVNTAGSTFRIDIYSNSARTTLVGHTATFTNTATGAKAITADNSSGLGGTITTDITVAASTSNDCRFLRLTVGTGEGASFTVGRRYFLCDFSTFGTQRISYVKVTAISGDVLTVDYVGPRAFAAGSFISPYPHRWMAAGSHPTASNFGGAFPLGFAAIPYVSSQGAEHTTGASAAQVITLDWMASVLSRVNPDDDNEYPVQFYWLVEAAGNRLWGYENFTVATGIAGLAVLADRRVLQGVAYLCLGLGGSAATCIIDTESLS